MQTFINVLAVLAGTSLILDLIALAIILSNRRLYAVRLRKLLSGFLGVGILSQRVYLLEEKVARLENPTVEDCERCDC